MSEPLVLGRPISVSDVRGGAIDQNTSMAGEGSQQHTIEPSQDGSRLSASSRPPSRTSTVGGSTDDRIRAKRDEELGDLSHKRLRRAAIAGNASPDSGGAAAAALASDKEPYAWKDVKVTDKHHIWSAKMQGDRRHAIKVRRSLLSADCVESPDLVRFHHCLALDLFTYILGLNILPRILLSQPRYTPRLL